MKKKTRHEVKCGGCFSMEDMLEQNMNYWLWVRDHAERHMHRRDSVWRIRYEMADIKIQKQIYEYGMVEIVGVNGKGSV